MPQIQAHPWYAQGLPAGVASMNEACLALRGQTAGLQSEADIQRVVLEAIGPAGGGTTYDAIIDEALEEDFGDVD